jgi:hypothetical protein
VAGFIASLNVTETVELATTEGAESAGLVDEMVGGVISGAAVEDDHEESQLIALPPPPPQAASVIENKQERSLLFK